MSNSIKVNYYDSFHCIAGECPFTCCQEWSISVEEATRQKWQDLKLVGSEKEREITLCNCLEKEDENYVIELDTNKQCPFLNQHKLCRLVAELDENLLSDTCTTYPRQLNTFKDRIEYTLDFGCPAVIDLVYKNEGKIQFHREGTTEHIPCGLYTIREMLLEIIQKERYSLTERMLMAFASLLDLYEQKCITDEDVQICKSREYLDGAVEQIREMTFNSIDALWERNELFLDLIQIYREEELYVEHLEEVILFAERLEEYYSDSTLIEKEEVFEKQYIRYQNLLQNYVVAEIFGGCLKSEIDLEEIIMMYQWIILEYSVIKHVTFLKWLAQEEKTLEYDTVKSSLMIVSRMAGYDLDDIIDYLEKSFENKVWKWGYLALFVGNSSI